MRQKTKTSAEEKTRLDEMLDEALKETFPASDPPAVIALGIARGLPRRPETHDAPNANDKAR